MNWSALSVFLVLFALVTVLGFLAARWRRGDLNDLDEWGLGGRRFGTFITWFLIGGDLYTAYTFIAVPAAMYGQGAVGFFAIPYTVLIYPLAFLVLPKLWLVSKNHGYITASDFVKGRFGSSTLALVIALTGILATMPYIALQLVGMQAVIAAMGVQGELPLLIAFAILAAYTYTSGLRAPAVTAVVKDLLIYIVVIVCAIVLPTKLGGFSHIFHAASVTIPKGGYLLSPKGYAAYATLSLGSALALFLYPHSVTGFLSSSSQKAIKRNAVFLPLYSLALGVIALLGFMAIAAGIKSDPTMSVPLLFLKEFPNWFTGMAFASIAIGALVPASIMSIAAANLFTRNIYKEYFKPNCSAVQEAKMAKLISLIVKVGALIFIVAFPKKFAINLQLLGGIWILQTLPAVFIGLYTKWLHRYALLLGWLAGMGVGTYMAVAQHMQSSVFPIQIGHTVIPAYAAIWALIVNLLVCVVFSAVFNALGVGRGTDETVPEDYQELSA